MRQEPPLTARPVLVEQRVHDLAQVAGARVPGRRPRHPLLLPRSDQRLDQHPLLVGQVGCVRHPFHTATPSCTRHDARAEPSHHPRTGDTTSSGTGLNALSYGLGSVRIPVVHQASITTGGMSRAKRSSSAGSGGYGAMATPPFSFCAWTRVSSRAQVSMSSTGAARRFFLGRVLRHGTLGRAAGSSGEPASIALLCSRQEGRAL